MACAVYLRELIIFTVIFHIICISHYKSIKSMDDNLYKNVASCLLVILLKINGYGVTATTVITESKTDLILLLLKQRGEL